MPQAHAQDGDLARKVTNGLDGDAGLRRRTRPRRDHQALRATGGNALERDLVVTKDFDLGAQLATPGPAVERITAAHVGALEIEIDRHEEELEPLKNFILPAGTPLAAAIHVARTVCRRAERRVVTLAGQPEATIPANAIEYLNRLGDLLFVLARVANRRAGVIDDPWHPH